MMLIYKYNINEIIEIEKRVKRVIAGHREHYSMKKIAEDLNLNIEDVYYILSENGYDVESEYFKYSHPELIVDEIREQYKLLKQDSCEYHQHRIKLEMAKEKYTPLDILMELITDKSEEIRVAVMQRNDLSKEFFDIASNDESKKVKIALIKNENAPDDALMKLFIKGTYRIKMTILERGKLSDAIVEIALNDNDDEIQAAAWSRLLPY